MKEYNPEHHDRHFAALVFKFPEHKSLFHSWQDAQESGLSNSFTLGERLYRLMIENGWDLA